MRGTDQLSRLEDGAAAAVAKSSLRFDLAILRGSLPPDLQAMVVEAFGILPSVGNVALASKIVEAFRFYSFKRLESELATESGQAARLRCIGHVARTLMALLHAAHDDDDQSPGIAEFEVDLDSALGVPLSKILLKASQDDVDLYRVLACGIFPPGGVISVEAVRGSELVLTHHAALRIATMGIAPIAAAADFAQQSAAAEAILSGRGGRRRTQVKPTTTLIIELISVYAEMRERYPSSGPKLAYSVNNPLDRSANTILRYAQDHWDELRHVSDGAIRAAYRKYRKIRRSRPVNGEIKL